MNKLIAALLLLSTPFISSSHAEINLKFGVYTSDKPTTMVTMFRPLLNSLEKRLTQKLGEPVKISLQVARNYKKGISALVEGDVDFSRMGPASYISSKEKNSELRLLAMESKKGKKIFYGIICVHENSQIKTISQLKGQRFAFGNENSTIGRYLSQHLLVNNKIFSSNLASYNYLGRHDRVGTAVGSKKYDAGALKESTFKKLKKKGVPIRELARFPNVTKPWIASSKMKKETFIALRTALIEFKDSEALKNIKKQGFLPTNDNDYTTIRESIKTNPQFFK